MAKLTTVEKQEILKPFVIESFQNGTTDVNEICGAAFAAGATKETGLQFGDLFSLTKQIGVDEGFIKTPQQRKEEFQAEFSGFDFSTIISWELLNEQVTIWQEKHDTPEKWSMDTTCQYMTNNDIPVPEKIKLLPWQKAAVDLIIENPDCTVQDMDRAIAEAGIQNYSMYTKYAYATVKELYKRLKGE